MLYSEFIEGTQCKDNAHNYQVYKNLEIMYMNSDMSKADIYEYGKKLVDNSKSPEQIAFEAKINAEIEEKKGYIKDYKEELERYEYYLGIESDENWRKEWKASIAYRKDIIKKLRNEIKALKWVLE